MAAQAPKIEDFFQNRPKVKGAKIQTIIKLREITTRFTILESLKAKRQDIAATIRTLIRVMSNNFLSLIFGKLGFTRFSPMIVAGASMAPLEVLKIAEINAPKNKILIAVFENCDTIMGMIF